ncbi:hypothetical protein Daus18300_000304 [Diaporthe australafricana]|uniref:Ankyrin repeat protein n=1 Tax=Diaporthe australafricana TaxID=127596 RepID=A0ABR3Y4N0_9PEZI
MNTLDSSFSKKFSSKESFSWCLQARYAGSGSQPVHFRLRRQGGKWKAYADEIDAALSLWLSSVDDEISHRYLQGYRNSESIQRPSNERKKEDDAWLRSKGSLAKQNLRLLGPHTAALLRDLRWWIPRDSMNVFQVREVMEGVLGVDGHRVVGLGRQEYGHAEFRHEREDLDLAEEVLSKGGSTVLLAAESYQSLKVLYAQDMYSAFMRAAAKEMGRPLPGSSEEIRSSGGTNDSSWQDFTLRNIVLSKMVQAVHDTGLGSMEQIYLSIVPPLSAQDSLPEVSAVFDLALQRAKRYEHLHHWREAGDTFLWLFRSMKTFPRESSIVARAPAILMAYLMTISEMKETQQKATQQKETQQKETRQKETRQQRIQDEDWNIKGLEDLELDLRKEFETVEDWIRSSLKSLYEECDPQELWRGLRRQRREHPATQQRAKYPTAFNVTGLHYMVQTEDPIQVKSANITDVDLNDANSRDVLERTPLHYTTTEGYGAFTSALLQYQTDVNTRDLFERTPLHYACRQDQAFPALRLLGRGAALNIQARDGATPLHYAASRGHERLVKLLIEAGADTNILDLLGRSPLHIAASNGFEVTVRHLWQGANRDLRDHYGRTALHLAVEGLKIKVVQLLLDSEQKADIDAKDREGQTPLRLAIELDQSTASDDITQLLLNRGADIELRDRSTHTTPLKWAAEAGRELLVQWLIKKGANLNAEDNVDSSPLHAAACSGSLRISQQLLDNGAAVGQRNSQKKTPLHYAARRGHVAVVQCLLDKNATIDATDMFGRTPLWDATEGGHMDVVELLLRQGASTAGTDRDGVTLIYLAKKSNNVAIVDLISGRSGSVSNT